MGAYPKVLVGRSAMSAKGPCVAPLDALRSIIGRRSPTGLMSRVSEEESSVGVRLGRNEYLVIEGEGVVAGLAEAEKHHVDLLFDVAEALSGDSQL